MEFTAEDVARRLGVKVDTVYAYVSRGVLDARRLPGTRRSVFDAQEVESLARRGRPRRSTRPAALDLAVETGLTTIVDQRHTYRGRDACAMAGDHTFEEVAHWLWTGRDGDPALPWQPYPITLPELAHPRDRLRAAVVLASAAEPLRADLGTTAVTATARSLIASMVATVGSGARPRPALLALDGGRAPVRASIAGRLWSSLGGSRPAPGLLATLNAALVLLADHELASSTMAARIAASVRADPFSVVLAGLGPMAGPLHGGASTLTHRMIADTLARGPGQALTAALETHGSLPGFGHPLYPDGDPRAVVLLGMLHRAAPGAAGLRAARTLIEAAARHSRAEPNVDLALGAFSAVTGMPATTGETVLAVARTAGWIAHAIEEYTEPPLRFRARATPRPAGRAEVPSGTGPARSARPAPRDR